MPALAPGGPVPPPVLQLPWGDVRPGGQVYLNQHSFEFLTLLWAALQGGNGTLDAVTALQGIEARINAQLAALREDGLAVGTLALSAPPPAGLTLTGVTRGAYGDGTHVAQFTVGDDGRLTAASNVPITAGGTPGGASGQIQYNNAGAFGGFTVSGDATVNTGTGALTLAPSGVTAGTYGDATHVAQVTVDAKGRVTAASNVAISGAGGSSGLPVIAEVVTSGSQSSVTISSIPATYRDLMVVVSGRSSPAAGAVNVQLQLNGDTGSNYDTQYVQGASGTASAGSAFAGTNATAVQITGSSATANWAGSGQLTLYNYANSTFTKIGAGTSYQAGGSAVVTFGTQWRSTAAITSLKLFPSSGTFVDGTVITVYGIGGGAAATLPVVPPQGRLTLTSNTPVMAADATAQTSIYYTPYLGTLLPIGNTMSRFSQITYALNVSAHLSGNLYDVFAFNNAGSIALGTGPAWTSSTVRSNAIQQDATSGIWVNSASIALNLTGSSTTTTVAAGQATYLGTFYATANGQTGMAFKPAAASGGTNNILGIWNAYNRVNVKATNRDSNADWTYNSTTWHVADSGGTGSGLNNRISFVDGLQQSSISSQLSQLVYSNAVIGVGYIGVNLDSTTAAPSVVVGGGASSGAAVFTGGGTVVESFAPQIGLHYVQRMERVTTGTATYAGNSALTVELEM